MFCTAVETAISGVLKLLGAGGVPNLLIVGGVPNLLNVVPLAELFIGTPSPHFLPTLAVGIKHK